MTQDEVDEAWSESVASIAVSELLDAGLIKADDKDRVTATVAKEILVRLIAGDRPDSNNWKYQPN
jgi:hypothetical protein